jgi:Skp family chaperone for outer membrane proteins
MNKEEMFILATRNKFRFPFRGLISVEDLWDLSVENLDTIFKTLNSQIKQVKEESLLNTKSEEDEVLDLQIEIVKYIVHVKLDEKRAKLDARAAKEKKQKLMTILESKREEDLLSKSAEEIQAMLDEIDD